MAQCLTAGGDEFYAFFEQSVNGYTMCDPKEAVMAAPNLNVGNFKFKSFGVECEFFVDRPVSIAFSMVYVKRRLIVAQLV